MSQPGDNGSKFAARVGLSRDTRNICFRFLERHVWAFTFGGLSLVLIAFIINEWTVNGDKWINWDSMLISGGLVFIITGVISLSLEKRFLGCVQALSHRQIFLASPEEIEGFLGRLETFNFRDQAQRVIHNANGQLSLVDHGRIEDFQRSRFGIPVAFVRSTDDGGDLIRRIVIGCNETVLFKDRTWAVAF